MIKPEDFSLQRRFRYLEWVVIILTASMQLVWVLAAVHFDRLITISFILLALNFVVSCFTPGQIDLAIDSTDWSNCTDCCCLHALHFSSILLHEPLCSWRKGSFIASRSADDHGRCDLGN